MLLNPLESECGMQCMHSRENCALIKICPTRKVVLAVLSSKQRSAIKRYIRINGYCSDNSHWIPVGDVIQLFAEYLKNDMKCWYCGKPMIIDTHPNGKPFEHNLMTLDHRLSLANGGSNKVENMVFCCFTCNKAKGLAEMHLPEWQKATSEVDEL